MTDSDYKELSQRIGYSFFCLCVTIVNALLFWFWRGSFDEKHLYELVCSVLFSMFFLFVPVVLSELFPYSLGFLLKSESCLLVILILLISFLSPFLFSKYIYFFGGLAAFLVSVGLFLKARHLGRWFVIGLFFSGFFSIWMFAIFKESFGDPVLLERFTCDMLPRTAVIQDLLYHTTIVQMIKNYNIPSTGLDGLPYVFYHYGSHWFFAKISEILAIRPILVYNVFYPLVIVPCFFKCVLSFSLEFQKHFHLKQVFSVASFAVFCCVFVGIPNHKFALGYYDNSFFSSESQAFSMVFMFALISTWLSFLSKFKNRSLDTEGKVFLLVLSPLIFAATGFLKISTLYVMLSPFAYLIFKYRRGLNYYFASLMITGLVSMIVYYFTVDTIPFGIRTLGNEGEFKIGAFYADKSIQQYLEPVSWFFMIYLWTLLVVVGAWVLRMKSRFGQGRNSYDNLSEVTWVLIIACVFGILPSFFLTFSNINPAYFVNIQMYVAGAILFSIASEIEVFYFSIVKRFSKVIIYSFHVLIFIIAGLRTKGRLSYSLANDYNMYARLSHAKHELVTKIAFQTHMPLILSKSKDIQKSLDSLRLNQIIKNLMALDGLTTTHNTIGITTHPETEKSFQNLSCVELVFIVPALTGYAMTNGIPSYCNIGAYGQAYYERQKNIGCEIPPCSGFNQLLIYNIQTNEQKLLSSR